MKLSISALRASGRLRCAGVVLPSLLLLLSGTALALPRYATVSLGDISIVIPVDPDGDDVRDADERNKYGTDPRNPDSDGDGLTDGAEIFTYGTNPKALDTDGDTLSDQDEIQAYGTDPKKVDTDGDGVPDNLELQMTYEYDALGRIRKVTDAKGKWIEYRYDPSGSLIRTIVHR